MVFTASSPLGWDQYTARPALVGHSMGGTLAVLLVAFHRSAVSLVHHGANMLARFGRALLQLV